MPWSPKSVLSAHQASQIRPFTYEVVARFIPLLRRYMHRPMNRDLRRQIFRRLGSMFQMHHSRLELRSILATLVENNANDPRFAARIWVDLDELRDMLNEDEISPPPSDDEF